MKVLKFITASAICMLTLFACSDSKTEDVPDDPKEEPKSEGVDYLVMFYAQGGETLDECILGNVYQALDEGSSDKVKMTFQYKLSAALHDKYVEFNGTRRFTLDDNKQFIGTYKDNSAKYPENDAGATKYLVENLKTEKIGDNKYDMSSTDALASFIKWSKELYPDAKHTILVISGHGNGWKFALDGKAATRAIQPDDNLNDKSLSATEINNAVKAAGGIELFYTDACLMAMYENLYEYSSTFKYMLSPMEVTMGVGGNYTKLLSLLKSANNTEAGLVDVMHKYMDYLISPEWWDNPKLSTRFADIGFYDLTKIDNLTPVLKQITDKLVEKITSDEKLVSPTSPTLPFGDSYRTYINNAINQCEIAEGSSWMKGKNIPSVLLPYMQADSIKFEEFGGNTFVHTRNIIAWMWNAPNNHAHEAYANYEGEWKQLRQTIIQSTATSFSLTDMLRFLGGIMYAYGVDDTFAKLHDELIAALKTVAYIRSTEPVKIPGLDQAYELCSPGIQIVPLNNLYYVEDFNHYNLKDIKTVEEALSIYQSTTFDKKVGWSRILSLINVQPSVFSNPSREEVLSTEVYNLQQGQ